MEQNRVYYPGFDVVKMILAILIVAAHCHFLDETSEHLYGLAQGIESFAIPSFFAISAFLFYGKVDIPNILHHTTKRLFVIFAVWYTLMLPLTYVIFFSTASLKETIVAILFNCTFWGYWFFKALIINTVILYLCRRGKRFWFCYLLSILLYLLLAFNNVHQFVDLKIATYYTFMYHTCAFFTGAVCYKYREKLMNWKISTPPILITLIILLGILSQNADVAIICRQIAPVFLITLSLRISNVRKEKSVLCRKLSTLFFVMQFGLLYAYDFACNTCSSCQGVVFLQYGTIRFIIIMLFLYFLSTLITRLQPKFDKIKYLY